MSDEEVRQLFGSYQWVFDIREWIPPNTSGRANLRGFQAGSGGAHPGSNFVGNTTWTAEEADAHIEAMIASHHERDIGFQWLVSSYDRPIDLAQRLEQHGMVLAGDVLMMARVGLDNLAIPINPHLTIEMLDGSDDRAIEAAFQVAAESFYFTQEQIEERRVGFFERIKNPSYREQETNYFACLNGEPVGFAALRYEGGLAFLGGAATVPAYRNRKIYSTLLCC